MTVIRDLIIYYMIVPFIIALSLILLLIDIVTFNFKDVKLVAFTSDMVKIIIFPFQYIYIFIKL